MDIDDGKTRPKKPSLSKIRERLLHERTAERFMDYEGVISDLDLILIEKIIQLQKGNDDATGRKIYFASLQGLIASQLLR